MPIRPYALLVTACLLACPASTPTASSAGACNTPVPMKAPLVTKLYTADPSAHVFEGKIYIYPSHDLDENPPPSDLGDSFGMKDYHVYSLDNLTCSPVIDHGEVLNIANVPWAKKQMWAPDAAFKSGTYYLYFPAKDEDGIFRIGVATSTSPAGPFKAEPKPIPGSFSIDPAVFADDDGTVYMYFGGLMGGQLQDWKDGKYESFAMKPGYDEPALSPKVVKMSKDMKSFDGPIADAKILDTAGNPILANDDLRHFFEGIWVHKYKGTYYMSYSTGQTHYLVYATSKSPTGPFTYKGRLLEPVQGWTTHHSIIEFQGKWYLFYHDSSLSGKDNQRCIKVAPLTRGPDGSMETVKPE